MLQIRMVHLKERYSTDVAETMRAQRTNLHTIGQDSRHVADGFAQHDLAAVCRCSDPCCVMYGHADRVVAVLLYLAKVYSHPNPQA